MKMQVQPFLGYTSFAILLLWEKKLQKF
jgi:hypothetical protein